MRSITIQPNKDLSSFVNKIMVIEKQVDVGAVTSLPFYADGFPGILFQQSVGGMLINNGTKCLSEFFLYGQTVKPITLMPTGSFRLIVFFLYPASINTLFRISPGEIRDSCADLKLLSSGDRHFSLSQLVETNHIQIQIDIISQYLLTQSQSNLIHSDNVTHHALEHIIRSRGQASLSTLRINLNVTERTFERRFEQLVGISPKLFSRICQFKSSLDQLRVKDFVKLSDLAYDNGYADQSHFIRSFKEFTGMSPLEYLKENPVKEEEVVED